MNEDDIYRWAPSVRTVVQLDPVATRSIIDNVRGRNNKNPLFIMIHLEGMLRVNGPHLLGSWDEAIDVAIRDPYVIYNARTKRASRVVWRCALAKRTIENYFIESVRLVPHADTLKQFPPRNSNARLFAIDEFKRD